MEGLTILDLDWLYFFLFLELLFDLLSEVFHFSLFFIDNELLYLLSVGYGEGSQLNEDGIVQFASKSSVLLIVHQTNAQLLEV
jgi:hypothetical protein